MASTTTAATTTSSPSGGPVPPPASQSPSEVSRAQANDARSGSSQHYSLRWNNHQSHVLNAFEALLQNESLVDCTLVCEDTSIRAHKVVLSACSPYFQKIFMDNPCKHPIIVLKDIRGWEVQCIVDFMYKGETSVPEAQLTSLIKAAESLRVRGLTTNDQQQSVSRSSPSRNSPLDIHAMNGYHVPPPPPPPSHHHGMAAHHHRGGYSLSPSRSGYMEEPPAAKIPHLSHSNQSSPMSLTNHQDDRGRTASPGPGAGAGSAGGPRRKQARPRRRSGDSIGNASLDLSKSDSPPLSNISGASNNNIINGCGSNGGGGNGRIKNSSPTSSSSTTLTQQHADETPENLSLNRPSSSPAINLVKTEHLMEESRSREHSRPPVERAHSTDPLMRQSHHVLEPKPPTSPFINADRGQSEKSMYGNGLHPLQEHEARAEALQALNFMASGVGMPPHFPGHPLSHPPHHGVQAPHHINPSSLASLAAAGAAVVAGNRPTSTPSAPSNSYPVGGIRGPKGQHSAPRGGPPRSWTNDELTKALENVWNKRMTTSQASRFYSIPYNSLLMYVRGKYGKSLKLDKLKNSTPAAHDTLNTIGNSRSTPKEKLLAKANKAAALMSALKNKENQEKPQSPLKAPLNCGHIKDVLLDMHSQQAKLSYQERFKMLEKQLPMEQAKLLLPFLDQSAFAAASSPSAASAGDDFMAHSPSVGSSSPEEEVEIEVDHPEEEQAEESKAEPSQEPLDHQTDSSADNPAKLVIDSS